MEAVSLAYDLYDGPETDPNACPIIFLHGLFWNKFMLRELAEELCEATRRKVFVPDLRNHDTSPFREECSTPIMTEDMKKFIEDRGLRKVVFVCHSFSSTIAYLILREKPELVEKLVMIDHPPFADYDEASYTDKVLPQFIAQNRFLKRLDPSLSLTAAKSKIMALCKSADEGQKHLLRKIAYDLIKEDGKFRWKTNHQFLIDKYRDGFFTAKTGGHSNHEMLIIRCKDSIRVTEEKCVAVLRHNPNTKIMTIPDCTHLLMFEKKDEFIQAVRDFVC